MGWTVILYVVLIALTATALNTHCYSAHNLFEYTNDLCQIRLAMLACCCSMHAHSNNLSCVQT